MLTINGTKIQGKLIFFYSLVENFVRLLIIFTSFQTHVLLPYHSTQSLPPFFNQSSLICAAHIFLNMWPSTGSGQYTWDNSLKGDFPSLSCCQPAAVNTIELLLAEGLHDFLSSPHWDLFWLELAQGSCKLNFF